MPCLAREGLTVQKSRNGLNDQKILESTYINCTIVKYEETFYGRHVHMALITVVKFRSTCFSYTRLINFVDFLTFLTMEETFVTSSFAFLHTKPFLKKVLLYKEIICSLREQILSL